MSNASKLGEDGTMIDINSQGAYSKLSLSRGTAKSVERRKSRELRANHVATSEVIYPPEVVEFLAAVETWKRKTGLRFPAHSQMFEIMVGLGYSKAGNG